MILRTTKECAVTFARGTGIFLKVFWLVIIADLLVTYLFDNPLSQALTSVQAKDVAVDWRTGLIALAASIIWFVIQAGFFVSIRYARRAYDLVRLKIDLLKYVQLLLVMPFVILVSVLVLTSMGITQFPAFQSPAIKLIARLCVQLLGSLVVFFWLDAPYRLKNFFKSVERAINLFFYNGAYIALILIVAAGSLVMPVYGLQATKESNVITFVLAKYALLFYEMVVVSCVFVLYEYKKHIRYAKSLIR